MNTKNGVGRCADELKLYSICKAYTNFVERIARQHNTTVNGMQFEIETA